VTPDSLDCEDIYGSDVEGPHAHSPDESLTILSDLVGCVVAVKSAGIMVQWTVVEDINGDTEMAREEACGFTSTGL